MTPKTKEEILNQYRDDRKTELLTGVWFSYKDVLEAMDEYAQYESVAVLKWLEDLHHTDKEHKIDLIDGNYYWHEDHDGDAPLSAEQVHEHYFKSKYK